MTDFNQNNQNGNTPFPNQQPYPASNQGNPQWDSSAGTSQWNSSINSYSQNNYQQNPYDLSSQMNQEENYHQPNGPTEASYQYYGTNQRYAQSLPGGQQNTPQPQKKGKVGLFIALALVLFVFVGVGSVLALNLLKGNTNVDKLLSAFKASSELKQTEAYTEIRLEDIKFPDSDYGVSESMATTLLNGAGINILSKADNAKQRFDFELDILLKGVEVLNLVYMQQGMEQRIEIPKLFKGAIYISADSMDDQITGIENLDEVKEHFRPDIIETAVKQYEQALNPVKLKSFKALEKKKYFKRIFDRYNERITIEKGSKNITVDGQEKEITGDVYQITEDIGDVSEFYINLIVELVQDDNFKPFVTEYLDRFISTAEKNKDTTLYNYIMLANGSYDFKSEWDEVIKSELIYFKELILERIDNLKEQVSRPSFADESAKTISALKESNSTATFVFVVDKIVKFYDFSFTMNFGKVAEAVGEDFSGEMFDSLTYHVTSAVLATNGDVKFAEFNKENALDLGNADEQALADLTQEVQGNLMEIIFSLDLF